jgi:hypothetical protein
MLKLSLDFHHQPTPVDVTVLGADHQLRVAKDRSDKKLFFQGKFFPCRHDIGRNYSRIAAIHLLGM